MGNFFPEIRESQEWGVREGGFIMGGWETLPPPPHPFFKETTPPILPTSPTSWEETSQPLPPFFSKNFKNSPQT